MEGFRNKILTSTPAVSQKRYFFNEVNPPSDIESPTESPPRRLLKKTTILEMVIEAINEIGVPKQGASYQAIKKWIIGNKEANPKFLNHNLKLSVLNGVHKGVLVRPKRSETTVGAKGFFMLPVMKVPNKTKSTYKTVTVLPKSINKTSPAKADEIITKKVKSPSQDKKIATKTKKFLKKAEAEKIVAAEVNSKTEAQKKSPANLPSKAVKKRVAKMPSKVKVAPKPTAKAPTKVKKVNSPEENTQQNEENDVFVSDSQSNEGSGNADVSSAKVDEMTTKKVKSPSQDKIIATKTKKLLKKAEAEKIVVTKVNSKAEAQKKSRAKLLSKAKAVKDRAAKMPSKVEVAIKPTAKASSKVKELNSPEEDTQQNEENDVFVSDSQSNEDSGNADVSPAKVDKMTNKKVKSESQDKKIPTKIKKFQKKAEAEKIVATKVNSKAESQKKSPAKLPSKAVKKHASKMPAKVEDAPKPAAKASSKVKKVNSPEEDNVFFSDSQSGEDSENADVMQGLKRGKLFSESESNDKKRGKVNSKLPTKKKTVKNNDMKSLEGGKFVIKDKGKAAKDAKKREEPNATSKNRTKLLQKTSKTAGKKLYSSENELEKQVSDTEVDNKKRNRYKAKLKRNIHKSCLSDTEFENSKRENK